MTTTVAKHRDARMERLREVDAAKSEERGGWNRQRHGQTGGWTDRQGKCVWERRGGERESQNTIVGSNKRRQESGSLGENQL